MVSMEELETMKDQYYKAKGWTNDGLIPKKKLIELGDAGCCGTNRGLILEDKRRYRDDNHSITLQIYRLRL